MAINHAYSLSNPTVFMHNPPPRRDLTLIFSNTGEGRFGAQDAVFLMVDDAARQCVALLTVGEQVVTLSGTFKPVTPVAVMIADNQPTVDGTELWNKAYAYMEKTQWGVMYQEEEEGKWQIELRGGFIDTQLPLPPERTAHEKMEAVKSKEHLFR